MQVLEDALGAQRCLGPPIWQDRALFGQRALRRLLTNDRPCLNLTRASVSLGQISRWVALAGHFGPVFDVAAHHVMASASGSACTYASEVGVHRTSKLVRVPSARFREIPCSKAHSVSSVSMAVADLARCAKHAMPSPAREPISATSLPTKRASSAVCRGRSMIQ